MNASIYSVYMRNVNPDVVANQGLVVEKFLPKGWTFNQELYIPSPQGQFHHATALSLLLARNTNPITIFLDIDCIPLSQEALLFLAEEAGKGTLVGAVQRANHIDNDGHLYVGPFCMAFKNEQYKNLNSPTFKETLRGDCGEELTYRWSEYRQPIHTMWPSSVYYPAWNLVGDTKFGYGTTYEDKFYHAFGIREGGMQEQFITKCQQILITHANEEYSSPNQEALQRESSQENPAKEREMRV